MPRLDPRLEYHLHLIEQLLVAVLKKETRTMSALDDLTAAVANSTTVEQSAITLLNELAALITAAAGDPAALAALAATITSNADALATAVATNAPVPPVV